MLTSPGGDPVSPSSPPGSNYLRDTVWTLSRPAVSITHAPAHINVSTDRSERCATFAASNPVAQASRNCGAGRAWSPACHTGPAPSCPPSRCTPWTMAEAALRLLLSIDAP